MAFGINFSEYQYGNMLLNERLLVEIQSIGLYPELVPDLPHNENEGISGEIHLLEEKHHEQVSRKNSVLENLLESTNEARELQENQLTLVFVVFTRLPLHEDSNMTTFVFVGILNNIVWTNSLQWLIKSTW